MADKDDVNLEEEKVEKAEKKKFQLPKLPKLPALPKKKKADGDGEVKEEPKEVKAKPAVDKKSGLSLPVKIMMAVVALLAIILILLISLILRANKNEQEAIQDEMEKNLQQAAIESDLEASKEIQEAEMATETPAPSVDVILDLIPETYEGQELEKMTLYMPALGSAGEGAAASTQIPAGSNVASMVLTDGKRYIAGFDDIIYTNFLAARDAQVKLETAYSAFLNKTVEKEAFMTYCAEVLTYQHSVTARISNGGNSNASEYITACENYMYLVRNSAANLIDYLKTNGSEDLLALADDTISQADAADPTVSEARRAYLTAEGFTAEELSLLKN